MILYYLCLTWPFMQGRREKGGLAGAMATTEFYNSFECYMVDYFMAP